MSKNDKERIEFSAIIGNPPYQVTKGGTKNVNVWQHFVKVANLCGAKYVSMIHPGRWVVPKDMMEPIRDDIVDSGLQKFDYYTGESEIFPNVFLRGGVTITNFKKDYKGDIDAYLKGKYHGKYSKCTPFLQNDFEIEIYKKIIEPLCKNKNTMADLKIGVMSGLGSDGFGYKKSKHYQYLKKDKNGMKNPLRIWATTGEGSSSRFSWQYIEKDVLDKIDQRVFSSKKVLLNKIAGGGYDSNTAPIVDKNCIGCCYFILPHTTDDDYELNLIRSLFRTKTCYFLMSITQKDHCLDGFENIPDYTYFIDDMKDPKYNNKMFENKLGLLTDEYFYKKFNFSQELIDYIESHISAKELV